MSEERQTDADLPAKGNSDDVEQETGSETATPPIDEDVAGSVNAAVPDTADE